MLTTIQRAHLMNPMVPGLRGGKMSASDPGRTHLLHQSIQLTVSRQQDRYPRSTGYRHKKDPQIRRGSWSIG